MTFPTHSSPETVRLVSEAYLYIHCCDWATFLLILTKSFNVQIWAGVICDITKTVKTWCDSKEPL